MYIIKIEKCIVHQRSCSFSVERSIKVFIDIEGMSLFYFWPVVSTNVTKDAFVFRRFGVEMIAKPTGLSQMQVKDLIKSFLKDGCHCIPKRTRSIPKRTRSLRYGIIVGIPPTLPYRITQCGHVFPMERERE